MRPSSVTFTVTHTAPTNFSVETKILAIEAPTKVGNRQWMHTTALAGPTGAMGHTVWPVLHRRGLLLGEHLMRHAHVRTCGAEIWLSGVIKHLHFALGHF